jgi:DNA-binding NarL/FixJ family response regulator
MNDERRAAGFAGSTLLLQTLLLTGSGPIGSVLICDDRPDLHGNLAQTLRLLPGSPEIGYVSHGFALVHRFSTRPADLVLVGIHRGSTAGAEAVTMLINSHPDAAVIVFGIAEDIELMADVFVRGARGLVLWDPRDEE